MINKCFITILVFFVSLSPPLQAAWPEYRGGPSLHGRTSMPIPTSVGMKWSFQTGDEIKSSPVIRGDHIIIGGTDAILYCLDLNGRLKWKFHTENAIEAPALILNDMVYVGDLGGNLYAIHLENGQQKWLYQTDNQINAAPNHWSDEKHTYLIFGSYDFYLHCVDAASGDGIWKYEAQNFLHASVAIDGHYAVFGGCDGLLHVVDIRNGKASSNIEIASYVAGSAALDRGHAYIGDYDGLFSCIDYRNQIIKWQFESRDRQLPFIASPAVSGTRVVIGSRDRFVYCLDKASGQLLWSRNTGSRIEASPLADNTNVLIANMRGDLMLLNLTTGNIIWTYELGSALAGSPAVADNMIVIGAMDGGIYALGPH